MPTERESLNGARMCLFSAGSPSDVRRLTAILMLSGKTSASQAQPQSAHLKEEATVQLSGATQEVSPGTAHVA